MNEIELQRLKHSVDLTELARRFTHLDATRKGPCPKCGGRDRFFIHNSRKHWGCRKCPVEAGDCVDLVMAATGCDFKAAVEYLGGEWRKAPPKAAPAPETESSKAKHWREDMWQIAARTELNARSWDWDNVETGVVYMRAHRGILEQTCKAFGVGYHDMRGQISLPYRLPDGRLTGIKYRKLKPAHDGDRFTMFKGSEPVVFGAQLLTGKDRLLLVEGEMNAMAVWQAAGDWLDVVSIGTESRVAALDSLIAVYPQAAVWVDRKEVAMRLTDRPGSSVTRLVSPDGMDANDLLKEGLLSDVLHHALT